MATVLKIARMVAPMMLISLNQKSVAVVSRTLTAMVMATSSALILAQLTSQKIWTLDSVDAAIQKQTLMVMERPIV
jgi:hypothetical protein